ncbi:MAG: O-antigen ligase family protein [Gemmatimonadaceae bacterium]
MRAGAQGWRSSRGLGAAASASAPPLPQPLPQPLPRAGRLRPQGEVAPVSGARFPRLEERFAWPWQGVDYSPAYLCFLLYFFIICSYVVNLGQAAMGAAILAITMGSKDRWRFPAPMFLMAAFMVIITLTFKSSAYRNYVWAPLEDMYKVFLIMLVGISVLNSRPRLRFFMFFALGTYALFPVRGGVFNWFIYSAATQGRVAWNNLFLNPNDYAALMLFPLGLCLVVFTGERSKIIKQLSFVGLAVMPMIIFMTQSRGAIIALAAGGLAYLVLQGKGRAKAILAVGGIAVVVVVFAPSSVWSRLSSLKSAGESGNLETANDNRSAEQRFEIWKVAWNVHNAYPITGVGWAAYPNAHSDFSRRSGIDVIARGARDAHNTYLSVLAETGWVGFTLWSGMLALIVMPAIRAMQRVRAYAPEYAQQIKLLLLSLLAYGVCAVFGSFAAMSFTYLHLATIAALTTVTNAEIDAFQHGARQRRGT